MHGLGLRLSCESSCLGRNFVDTQLDSVFENGALSLSKEVARMGMLWALHVRSEMCWQSCVGKFTQCLPTLCLAVICAFSLQFF